jgi:ribosomal protein S10
MKFFSELLNEMVVENMMNKFNAVPLDQFVKQELDEADMLGATTKVLPPDELQAYLQRTAAGEKDKLDKYKMPYVHRGNIQIKDENDRTFDLDKLKAAISARPEKILKQNEKITHSGGESTIYFNIGLPALKGLAVNEATGDFVVVDTCPGAGACKVYCYAKKGGYVQWKASSMSQTRQLNFLLNDPQGYKNKLESELRAAVKKFDKKGTKVAIRWHDAGDFFSPEYLDLAYSVAKDFPNVDFYAYTKMASVASGNKPSNFKMNFSMGATPDQEKQIDFQKTKHSTVVPKQMFDDLVMKDDKGKAIRNDKGQIQFSDENLDILKKKLADKYKVFKDSIITYDEMKDIPVSTAPQWNVIVKPGDGDESANRADVIGTWLLIH